MMTFPIYGKIKVMFQSPPTSSWNFNVGFPRPYITYIYIYIYIHYTVHHGYIPPNYIYIIFVSKTPPAKGNPKIPPKTAIPASHASACRSPWPSCESDTGCLFVDPWATKKTLVPSHTITTTVQEHSSFMRKHFF